MSRKHRFKANFTEEKPIEANMSGDGPLDATFGYVEPVTRTSYNFGDGISYNSETNTLSAYMTDEIKDGSKQLVTSGAVAKAIGNAGVVYSSDERIVGKWDDDKTLYERTITASDVTIHNSREQSLEHGIDDVDMMVVSEVFLKDTAITRSNGNFINAIGGVMIGSNAVLLQWVADDTYIWVNSTSYFNANENRTWKIVVRYTKVGNE